MTKPALSLTDWIKKATAGLPPSAVSKFSAEITDHTAESRGKHIAEGMPPDDADRAALADLGDAAQVALTFRDAHFSRREYTRGMLAVLALLAMNVVDRLLIFRILSVVPGTGVGADRLSPWWWFWKGTTALAAVILALFMVRALLVFLREQYDIQSPRWGWPLLVVCLLATLPAGSLPPVLVWAQYYSPFDRVLHETGLMSTLWNLYPPFSDAAAAAFMVVGALAIGFCVWQRPALSRGSQPSLRLCVVISGLAGIGLVSAVGLYFAPGDIQQSVSVVPFPYLYLALLVILAGLFGAIRRPGATLAR